MWNITRSLLPQAIALVAAIPALAFAQHWQDIATFRVHEAAPYFLDEDIGFVFTPGEQVFSKDLTGAGTIIPFDASKLPNGNYFAVLRQGNDEAKTIVTIQR